MEVNPEEAEDGGAGEPHAWQANRALADALAAVLPGALQAALQPLRDDIQQLVARVEQLELRLPAPPSVPAAPGDGQLDPFERLGVDAKAALSPAAALRAVAPRLDSRGHKGQAGRIGVLGGSVDFSGAPYYAGIAALRAGAELLYLCTAEEATLPIKTYSPELMVSSIYSFARMSDRDAEVRGMEQQALAEKMMEVMPRLHSLCIGPGLGRHDGVLAAVARVIEAGKARNLPMVIDADGLWLVADRPDLVRGYRSVVLTPNLMEYRRLAKAILGDEAADLRAVCTALQGAAIVLKGPTDRVFAVGEGSSEPLECSDEGAPRRPGGIGDILSGILATVLGWSAQRTGCRLQACRAACVLVRRASRSAYAKHKRAMVAPDIIGEIGPAMQELCPA